MGIFHLRAAPYCMPIVRFGHPSEGKSSRVGDVSQGLAPAQAAGWGCRYR